jgi:inosose dehydratase
MRYEKCNDRNDMQSIPRATRRQFVCAALTGAAAAAICRGGDATAKPANAVVSTLGFNTYGLHQLTTEDAIRTLAKIGYDSVQFDAGARTDADPATVNAARRADLRKVLQDTGLKLTAMQGVGSPTVDDKRHAADLERFKVMAQYAHDLCPGHPPLIEAGLGGRDPFAKMKPLFLRRLADWVKLAEASDIHIVIKPHRDTSMDRPEQAVELFKDLGSPERLRMSYDYSHFVLRDMPLEETIRVALPWTGFVALKDCAIENGKSAFKLPGETGKIDYAALLRQFHEGGYRGDYNCEVSVQIWRKPGYDGIVAAKTCYESIAPAFVAAGVPRARGK